MLLIICERHRIEPKNKKRGSHRNVSGSFDWTGFFSLLFHYASKCLLVIERKLFYPRLEPVTTARKEPIQPHSFANNFQVQLIAEKNSSSLSHLDHALVFK